MANSAITISKAQARSIWLRAQQLDRHAPFGNGPQATPAVVQHLGYVQIDTINVIERCHHHILYTRIPEYRREHLHQAQTIDKSVFEYWGHALAYLPTADFRFHVRDMRRYTASRHPCCGSHGTSRCERWWRASAGTARSRSGTSMTTYW